jgi:hypothetical protein
VSDRARLFDSLPDEALRGLLKRWSDTADFPLFLRQLIAALALGKLRLPLSKGEVEAFVDTGFDDEGMVSSQREAVIQQVETHLRQSLFAVDRGRPSLPPPDDVVGIGQELRQEIVRLSGADPQTRLRLLQLPKPTGVR